MPFPCFFHLELLELGFYFLYLELVTWDISGRRYWKLEYGTNCASQYFGVYLLFYSSWNGLFPVTNASTSSYSWTMLFCGNIDMVPTSKLIDSRNNHNGRLKNRKRSLDRTIRCDHTLKISNVSAASSKLYLKNFPRNLRASSMTRISIAYIKSFGN